MNFRPGIGTMPRMTFADWLGRTIKRKGTSQRAVAREAGLSLGRMAAYASGESQPSLANARKICRALGVSLATLDKELDRQTASLGRGKP